MSHPADPFEALRAARLAIQEDLLTRSTDLTEAIADFLHRVDAAMAESIALSPSVLGILATLRPAAPSPSVAPPSSPTVPAVPLKAPSTDPVKALDTDSSPEEIRALVLSALGAGDEGAGQITARIWAGGAITAARTEKVHTALTQLKAAGKIVRLSRGKYAPAPKDANIAEPTPVKDAAAPPADPTPTPTPTPPTPPAAEPVPAVIDPSKIAFQVLATGMAIPADRVIRLAAGDTIPVSTNITATDTDIQAVNNAPAVPVALGVEYAILVQETDGLFVYRALAISA